MNKFGLFVILFALLFGSAAVAGTSASPAPASRLMMVVVLSRHGVRSPTHPKELQAYAAQPWPSWSEVRPGYLTARGASLMRQFGEYYRRAYGQQLGFGARGCPPADSVFVWADVDQRTKATGDAVVSGFAPGCGITVGHAGGDNDALFDPLPGVGVVNQAQSTASILGAVGGSFGGVVEAYNAQFSTMEQILGCTAAARCKRLADVATYVTNDGDGGLASLNGGLDMAGDVAGNLLLEYVDGHRVVGWSRVNHAQLLELLQLDVLGRRLEHNRYGARAHSSNIMAHILQTLQEGATGKTVAGTRVPATARFVFLSGHDTQLAELQAMFGLSWLVKGDQFDDTPPGGALVFEVRQPVGGGEPFVRTFFTEQSLDAMRAGQGQNPLRVPVYVPGCPALDCPMETFANVVNAAIDPSFVGTW
ncbi:MAG: histidine-type phosphatase [Candidatus Eremiobacteraeota bacterium]|nr:histidine-type phosphatase [Candidatus Eremiobacteraeota bacterium]